MVVPVPQVVAPLSLFFQMFSCATSAPLHCSLRCGLPCFFSVSMRRGTSHVSPTTITTVSPFVLKKKPLSMTRVLLMEENQPFCLTQVVEVGADGTAGIRSGARFVLCSQFKKILRVLEISRRPEEVLTLQWRKITWRDRNPQKKRAETLEFGAYPEFSNFKIWPM